MTTPERVLKYAEATLIAALVYAVLWQVPQQVQVAANAVRTDALREGTQTREALIGLLQPIATGAASLPGIADRHLGTIEDMTGLTLAHGLDIIDQRTQAGVDALKDAAKLRDDLKPVLTETARTIAAARPVLAELGTTVAAARPAFVNVGRMTDEIHAALTPMLDCKGNAACLPSQTTGILGSTKTLLGEAALTTREWRRVTPTIAANIGAITGNAEKLSHPHWYVTAAKIGAPVAAGVILGKIGK